MGRFEGSRLYLLQQAASLLGVLCLGKYVEVDQRQPCVASLVAVKWKFRSERLVVTVGRHPLYFLLLRGCQQRLSLQNSFPSEAGFLERPHALV